MNTNRAIKHILRMRRTTLSIAESVTGGLISHKLTGMPGCSEYYKGSVTAYRNEIKTRILGVSEKKIKVHGPVSAVVARDMAKGIRRVFKTNVGLATTGIAGPQGLGKNANLGLVYIACSNRSKTVCKRFCFKGSRSRIKSLAAKAALDVLLKHLRAK